MDFYTRIFEKTVFPLLDLANGTTHRQEARAAAGVRAPGPRRDQAAAGGARGAGGRVDPPAFRVLPEALAARRRPQLGLHPARRPAGRHQKRLRRCRRRLPAPGRARQGALLPHQRLDRKADGLPPHRRAGQLVLGPPVPHLALGRLSPRRSLPHDQFESAAGLEEAAAGPALPLRLPDLQRRQPGFGAGRQDAAGERHQASQRLFLLALRAGPIPAPPGRKDRNGARHHLDRRHPLSGLPRGGRKSFRSAGARLLRRRRRRHPPRQPDLRKRRAVPAPPRKTRWSNFWAKKVRSSPASWEGSW